MPDQCKIIIIEADVDAKQQLKREIEKSQSINLVGESDNYTDGYQLIQEHHPEIVFADIGFSVAHALGFAEKISQKNPELSLFITSRQTNPELIRQFMRAGARDFLTKPIKYEDLKNAIGTALRLKRQKMISEGRGGKIFTIFGVKGGVGTSTIATNLAISLKTHSNRSVVILDLNLQLGNVPILLNVPLKYSIVDIVNNLNTIEPDTLKDLLPKDSSGINVICGPLRPEESDIITTLHLDQILNLLKLEFDYIIVDTNVVLNDLTLKAFDDSDMIITVLEYDILSVYNARRCLDIFKRMKYGEDKVVLLINRFDAGSGFAFQEFKQSIKYPIFWKIPNQDYNNVLRSINKGIPISKLLPKSKVSQSFAKLAIKLNGGIFDTNVGMEKSESSSIIGKIFHRKQKA